MSAKRAAARRVARRVYGYRGAKATRRRRVDPRAVLAEVRRAQVLAAQQEAKNGDGP